MADSVNPPPRCAFAHIQTATEHELRMVLAGLCADEATSKRAAKIFNHREKTAKPGEGDKQRPALLYSCANCNKTYSDAQNAADACRYHTAIVNINFESEAYTNCDEPHIFDDESMRYEYPEAFMWICCNGALNSAGCMTSSHEEGGIAILTTSPSVPTDEKSGNKRTRHS